MTGAHVLIAGGGIAGIAAALDLARAGVRVTLVETRKKLGGRATSFVDARTGETLDNCQHVAMGCCPAYLSLCKDLGVDHLLTWTRAQHWHEAGGRVSVLKPGLLPAPAHFAEAFTLARFLTLREKIAIARGMLALRGATPLRGLLAPGRTFSEVLRDLRQPEGAVRKFWLPVIVSACNLHPDRADANLAAKVFREGFLRSARDTEIGVSSVPLVRLYDAAFDLIQARGGTVILGASVERLTPTSLALSRAEGDALLTADAVVCALPCERVPGVVDPAFHDERFAAIAQTEFSPILGVHLFFDRPVLSTPHAVLVDRPTQWIFRKDDQGARLHAVISAADDWMPLTEDQIASRVLDDLAACVPASRGAKLVSVRAVKEKRATFAATPAFQASRPATVRADGGGVILAGDYIVPTGDPDLIPWPATMEGATRSGQAAAREALRRLHAPPPAR
ncbi:MAG: hydroxysqualene dehydroxylase HpnE [Planctomycetota bacterium]|nr:hydroxysqualene dehydroxylase HpnE [Planctomycetota bacterium]